MTAVETIKDYDQLVAVLKKRHSQLSPRLQDVAQFLLNNPEDGALLTIVEIGKSAGVPPSAITRFTRELGFERFSELQAVFRQRLIGPRIPYAAKVGTLFESARTNLDLSNPHSVLEVFTQSAFNSLIGLKEDLKTAPLLSFVDVLREANSIHIVGGRGAFGVASYCYYGFSSVGQRAFLIDNLGSMRVQQMKAIAADDVLLAISFDDYTPETIEVANLCVAQDIKVLTITDNELSPLVAPAQYALFVKEARLGHFRSQVPAMVLCQSIIASVAASRD
jgi:DNA-binding MurR/RpiR family transcriptional regulator